MDVGPLWQPQVLVLLLPILGPSSLSELSWEPLRACRAKGPVLPLLGHLDSRKLWTSYPERGLRPGYMEDRLSRGGPTGPLVPNSNCCYLPGPGSFPAPLPIWNMPAEPRPLDTPVLTAVTSEMADTAPSLPSTTSS